MNRLICWMIKDNWHMHWRKWRYYFREDLHVFCVLFLLYFLVGTYDLLKNQIKFEREIMEQSVYKAISAIFSNQQQTQLILLLSILKIAVLILCVILLISTVIFFFSHSLKELLIQKKVIQFKYFENVSVDRMVAELLLEKWGSLPMVCMLSMVTAAMCLFKLSTNSVFMRSASFLSTFTVSLVVLSLFLFGIFSWLYSWMIKKTKALEIFN